MDLVCLCIGVAVKQAYDQPLRQPTLRLFMVAFSADTITPAWRRAFGIDRRSVIALIEGAVEDFVDYAGSNCDQYQVRACLLPFVAVVMWKSAQQSTIKFLGDAWRKRLPSGEVLLYSGWQ